MAAGMPNVVIALLKCASTRQVFGLRLEETSRNTWSITWAFPIAAARAAREGYSPQLVVHGSFSFAAEYPGCPYCRANTFFVCNCGTVQCIDAKISASVCPWCGEYGEIRGILDRITAGGDR